MAKRKLTPFDLVAAPPKSKKKQPKPKTWKQVERRAQSNATVRQAEVRSTKQAAKPSPVKMRREAFVRSLVGLPRRGYGTRRNDFSDLLTGRSRFTTPSERKQSIVLKDHLGRPQKRPGGGVIRVKPFGMTTLDEDRKELRRHAKASRKYRSETESLRKESLKLKTIGTQNALIGKQTPKAIGKRAQRVAAELDTRGKRERNTQAEGMLSALDNLSRPYYGVTGAGKAIVQGKRPDRVANEAAKGLALKTKTEAWDVLDAAGVKNKYIKYGAGIPAAFAFDPMSYVSVAAAPASGGASLAALSPKATKIAKLLSKASTASTIAKNADRVGKAGKADRYTRKAKKLQDKVFRDLGPIEHGPLTADDAYRLASKKKGVKLRVGARVPGTQKFVGVQTSGDLTRKLRNTNRPRQANAARDAWVKEMSPTGRMASLTENESETVLEAAAALNETTTRAGSLRKQTEKGMRAALRREIGVSKADRLLHPRKSRAKEMAARRKETFAVEETGKSPYKTGEYADDLLRGAWNKERAEGMPTPKYEAGSTQRIDAFDTAADYVNAVVEGKKIQLTGAKKGLEDKPVQRRRVDSAPPERQYSRSGNTTIIRQSTRVHREVAEKIKATPFENRTPETLRKIASDGRLDNEVKASLTKLADELDTRIANDAQAYRARYFKKEIDAKAQKKAKKMSIEESPKYASGGRNPKAGFAKGRQIREKLRNIRRDPDDPNTFSDDFIGTTAKRLADSELDIARHRFNQAIKSTGRKARAGESTKALPEGQSVYAVDDFGRLGKTAEPVPAKTDKEFVVLKDSVVSRAEEVIGGAKGDTKGIGRTFDKVTGKWKGSVTVMWPGYYARNLIGDTTLAMQAGTDVKSGFDSLRINRASRKREKILRKGQNIDKGKDPDAALKKLTFKIDGKTYSGKELEDLALEHAAIGGGQHGAEVAQLVGKDAFSTNNPLARLNIRRENMPRRATFIAGMKRGMTPQKAAAHARKEHFDYGTRTEFQKQVRRVIPFFSWWDLNTRKQLRQLVTDPGKSLRIYHVLNGASSAAGYENYRDYLANLNPGKQKGLPIPIVYGFEKDGTPKVKDVQFGNVLSDLRTVLRINPVKWGDEVLARGNPLVKTPLELLTNHSGFFGGEIEPDYAPWTPAPSALKGSVGKAGIDTKAEKALGSEIVMKLDRKSGEYVPHWKRKTDYKIRSLGPWMGLALGAATKKVDTGVFDKSQTDSLIALSGVSPSNHYPKQAELGNLYDKRGKLMTARNGLSHVKGSKSRRKNLTKRIDAITHQIHKLEKGAGYKKPTASPLKKKSRGEFDEFEKDFKSDEFKEFEDKEKGGESFDEFEKPKTSRKPKKKSVKSLVAKAAPNLDNDQKEIVAQIISIGKEVGASDKEIKAAIATGRVESNFRNSAVMTDHDSQGWRQERASLYKDPTNLKASIKRFYAETKQADRKGLSAGELAANVQRPAAQYRGRYAENMAEAEKILAVAKGGKAPAAPSVKRTGKSIVAKTGLKKTSDYRDPAHNAAVGGVPNSYHTRGSKKNPQAMDFVGTEAQMQKGAKIAREKGLSALIHDAGSGRHLHIQNDGGAMGGGGSGGGAAPATGGYSGGSYSPSAPVSGQLASRSTPRSERFFDTAEGRMALLEFINSRSKDRTKKLIFAMKAAQA